jgi:ADP-sugar diphosphatase
MGRKQASTGAFSMKQVYLLCSGDSSTGINGGNSLGIAVTSLRDALRYCEQREPGKTRGYQKVIVHDNLERALASLDARTIVQLPEILGAVPVTGELDVPVEVAINSVPFRNWLASMDTDYFTILRVHIQAVDMFGPKVGFIKFIADVVDPQGGLVPGGVFMRGGAVGMLPVFVCGREYFTALTVQPRLPTGRSNFIEIPAGMLDGSGNFAGTASRELDEELGIKISDKDLTDLSALAGNNGTFLSPGGCDEVLRYLGFKKKVDRPWLREMNGKCTGLLTENEKITLKIVPMRSLWRVPDAKTVTAYTYFRQLNSQIKLVA